MSKQKKILLMFFVGITIISQQICDANQADRKKNTQNAPLAIYDASNKRVPIGDSGANIVGYAPMNQEDIRVRMLRSPHSQISDLHRIELSIENPSAKPFKLDSVFPKRLYKDDDYVVSKNTCEELGQDEKCIFVMEGSALPFEEFSSDSYIKFVFIDKLGKEETRIVRPWAPLLLSPTSFEFSKMQDLGIRNIFPDILELRGVKEIQLVDGKEQLVSVLDYSKCKKIKSNEICNIQIPPYTGDNPPARYLKFNYIIKNSAKDDIFAVLNSLYNFQEGQEEDRASIQEKPEDRSEDGVGQRILSNEDSANHDILPDSDVSNDVQASSRFKWVAASICSAAAVCAASVVVYCYNKRNVAVNPQDNNQPGNIVPMAAMAAAVAETLLPPNPVEDFQPKDLTRESQHGTPPAVLSPAVQENPRAEALFIPGRRATMLMTTADAAIIKAREEVRAEEALATAKREKEAAFARLEEAKRAAEARRKEAEAKKKVDIEAEQRKRMEAEVRRRPPTETPGSMLLPSAPGEKRYPSRSTTVRVKKPGDYFK